MKSDVDGRGASGEEETKVEIWLTRARGVKAGASPIWIAAFVNLRGLGLSRPLLLSRPFLPTRGPAGFDVSSLKEVCAGRVPYGYGINDIGYIVFGKVKISDPDRYIFVRWFVGVDDEDDDDEKVVEDEVEYTFHGIYTEEKPEADGTTRYRAIMSERDELFFFSK